MLEIQAAQNWLSFCSSAGRLLCSALGGLPGRTLGAFEAQRGMVVDYVLPQFGARLDSPLPKPATYSCGVGLLRQALQLPPLSLTEGDARKLTLHACRPLFPTLAGQMLMSIESRRVLGHWGPNSAEPLRYDTSRCVSELACKAQVSSQVIAGWRPGEDFEPPPLPVELPPPLPDLPRPQFEPIQGDGRDMTTGWVANAEPHRKGKPRCLHILAQPGITKCGWKFGQNSRTPKTFFVVKPDGTEFSSCGACTAPTAFLI